MKALNRGPPVLRPHPHQLGTLEWVLLTSELKNSLLDDVSVLEHGANETNLRSPASVTGRQQLSPGKGFLGVVIGKVRLMPIGKELLDLGGLVKLDFK